MGLSNWIRRQISLTLPDNQQTANATFERGVAEGAPCPCGRGYIVRESGRWGAFFGCSDEGCPNAWKTDGQRFSPGERAARRLP